MFIRVDVEDCPLAAKEFQIGVLPSLVILEQQLKDGGQSFGKTNVLDFHIGQKIESVDNTIRSWFYNKSSESSNFVDGISTDNNKDKELR